MTYTPRTKEEILFEMVGHLVSTSTVTDIQGTAVSMLGAVADAIQGVEFRMMKIRDSYSFDRVDGVDLILRAKDLPNGGVEIIGKAAAVGNVLTLTRQATGLSYTLPAGAIFGRTDSPSLQYVTTDDVVFGSSVTTVSGVKIICVTPGVVGNAPLPNTINRLVKVPNAILSVSQPLPLGGGVNQESYSEFRTRLKLYLSSLSSGTPSSLEYIALSHINDDGSRARFAKVFEDTLQPAFSELVVDDGTGFAGSVIPGQIVSGTIPPSGTLQLTHQAPATGPITKIVVNDTLVHLPVGNPHAVSIYERGILQLYPGQTILAPGDVWSIGGVDAPYTVYTGFISSLQRVIEGDYSSPVTVPGKRPAGTRVTVRPPDPYYIDFTINAILNLGADPQKAVERIVAIVTEFMLGLNVGGTLYLSQLYEQLQDKENNGGLLKAVEIVTPNSNISPASAKQSLRAGTIKVV